MSRKTKATLITSLLLLLFALSVSQAHRSRQSQELLVKIVDNHMDLAGADNSVDNICVTIQRDGRFWLEERIQPKPGDRAELRTLKSHLTKAKLEKLEEIIGQEEVRHLPTFVAPAFPLGVNNYHAFIVRINREQMSQKIGFLAWRGEVRAGGPPASTSDDVKRAWKESEAALQPMVDWVQELKHLKLRVSKAAPSPCDRPKD